MNGMRSDTGSGAHGVSPERMDGEKRVPSCQDLQSADALRKNKTASLETRKQKALVRNHSGAGHDFRRGLGFGCGVRVARLLDQFGDEAGPSGLMVGAEAGAVIAVEVFEELDQLRPVRVRLKLR